MNPPTKKKNPTKKIRVAQGENNKTSKVRLEKALPSEKESG
jgi:hypothetical protein